MSAEAWIYLAGIGVTIIGVWMRSEVKSARNEVRICYLETEVSNLDGSLSSLRESIELLRKSLDRLITIEELRNKNR